MGLRLHVYRPTHMSDCTKGGLTSSANVLVLVNAEGPFEPTEDEPAVRLEWGPGRNNPILVPDGPDYGPDRKWARMFGGNYAGTSDSRFGEAVQKMATQNAGVVGAIGVLPVHDRYED